ncbi:MAG: hypothetical protein ACJ72Q_14265 [Nitrososphaeraceae archaeon]
MTIQTYQTTILSFIFPSTSPPNPTVVKSGLRLVADIKIFQIIQKPMRKDE